MGAGAQGPPGPQGQEGDKGPLGPLGPQGPAGPMGPKGPKGPKGPQGPQGMEGPPGPAGPVGPMGPEGLMGLTGTMGPIGLTGPQGLKGETGPIGPPGKDSLPTDVAKNLLAQNDFLNNLALSLSDKSNNYYTSLIGQTGPTGPIGPQGPKGDKGDTPSTSSLIGSSHPFISNLSNIIINSEIGTQFANNVANTIGKNETTINNFTTSFYNKINQSTDANSFISKLANNLTSNPEYQSILQGPQGDISDPVSLEKTMIPKTIWCSNGSFGNFNNVITDGLICNTPFSTSGNLYVIGNSPKYNNETGTYDRRSDVLKIGDWILGQNIQGDLEVVNMNPKLSNTQNIKTNSITCNNIKTNSYSTLKNNKTIIQGNKITTDGTDGIKGNRYSTYNRTGVMINENGQIGTFSITVPDNINAHSIFTPIVYANQLR